jgi:hypothetical protein
MNDTNKKLDAHPVFEIFRISPAQSIPYLHRGNEFVASWDQIKWSDCLKIGLALKELLAEFLKIDTAQIFYEESHEYTDGLCKANIIFFVNHIDGVNYEINFQEVQSVVSEFLDLSYLKNKRNLNILNPAPTIFENDKIIHKHIHAFLTENGGKKLATQVSISCNSVSTECGNAFSPRPAAAPHKVKKATFTGKISGMCTAERSFLLETSDKLKKIIQYDENSFFKIIKELLGEPIINDFEVFQKEDAKGREIIVLFSIENSRSDPDLLI